MRAYKTYPVPVPCFLYPPPCQASWIVEPGVGAPSPGPGTHCAEDLDVDEETVDERESELDGHGGETKADANTSFPFLSAGIIVRVVFPLKDIIF